MPRLIVFIVIYTILGFALGQPVAAFQANQQRGCPPLVIQFQDQSSQAVAWEWDTGVGVSTLQHPNAVYTTPGLYTIRLVVTDASGQRDTLIQTQYIEVYRLPQAALSASPRTACAHTPITFTSQSGAGSGTITNWTWDFGDGNISQQAQPVHVYTHSGTFPVSLTVVNQYGCEDNITLPAFITIQAPDPAFTSGPTLACGPPLPVQFTSTGTVTGQHEWLFGDGGSANVVNPLHVYTGYGSFHVTHIVADAQGCRDTLTRPGWVNIGVNTLNIGISDTSICRNDTIFFSTNAASNATATWDFGDGSSGTGINPWHIYTTPGTFTVSALISDASGCSFSQSRQVTIYDYPVMGFTVADTNVGCAAPFPVQFVNQTTGATTFNWSFGDGTSSNQANPLHVYQNPGNYTVQLLASGPLGCTNALRINQYIRIVEPKTGFRADVRGGCAPLTVTFEDTSESVFPIVQWLWNFGDGTTSTLQHPVHTYADTGQYTVTLTTVNSEGCTSTSVRENFITAGQPPVAGFTISTDTACALAPVQFTSTSTGQDSLMYVWYFGDGDTAMSANPAHGFSALGPMDVTLVVSDRGCTDTLTQSQAVEILAPLPIIAISDRSICEVPATVTFQNFSIGYDSFAWTLNGSVPSTQPNFSYTFTADGSYGVSLTVSNQLTGCITTAYDSVKVLRAQADFVPSVTHGCTPLTVRFQDQSANPILWKWDFGVASTLGDTANSANPVYTYSQPGIYEARLIIRNSLECRDTLVYRSIVSARADAAFGSLGDSSACMPAAVQFQDRSSSYSPIVAWDWDLGDGTTSALQHPAHVYTAAGSYTVKLRVTDQYGCQDSLTRPNFVQATQPIPDFLVTPRVACQDEAVTFVSLSSGVGLSFNWDFGDGATSVLANPVHTYTQTGTYDIRLTITDVNGCDSTLVLPGHVVIQNLAAAFNAAPVFAACPPLAVDFAADTSFLHEGIEYIWNFGNGASANQPAPTHIYTQPGTYDVQLIVRTPSGCADTLLMPNLITVGGPTAAFSFTPLVVCPGDPVFFSATSTDSVSYAWSFGDGTTGIGQQTTHAYQTPGIFSPVLIVEDTTGCQVYNVSDDQVTVLAPPQAAFTVNSRTVCHPGTVQFSQQSTSVSPVTAWQWDFGDGTTDTVANPVHTYALPGTYTVRLIVWNALGCSDTLSENNFIQVFPTPIIQLQASDTTGCTPLAVTFEVTAPGHPAALTQWQWYFGLAGAGSTQAMPQFVYTQGGTYATSITATDSNGCQATAGLSVTAYTSPTVQIDVSDSLGCAPFGVQFSSQTTGSVTQWAWDLGDNTTSTQANPAHTYPNNGTYDVSLAVTDSMGCTGQALRPALIRLDAPVADFRTADTVICANLPISFEDQSRGWMPIIAWNWSFGDGTTSTQQNPTHAFAPGNYTISLTVTDSLGCSHTLTRVAYIEAVLQETPEALEIAYVSVLSDTETEVHFAPYHNTNRDFSAYLIYRQNTSGGYDLAGQITDLATTRYTDTGLDTRHVRYCYKVAVLTTCGVESVLDQAEPHCTVLLTATAGAGEVFLSWSDYIGWETTNWLVYRVQDYGPNGRQLMATLPGNVFTWLDTAMYCYDTYTYRVVASGLRYRSWSDTAFAAPSHVAPDRPVHVVRATVENNQTVQVSWDLPPMDDLQDIVVERYENGAYREQYRTPATNVAGKYEDTGVNVQTSSFRYRVMAVDSCGAGSPVGRPGNNIVLEARRESGRILLEWLPYEGWENGVETYGIEIYDEAAGVFIPLVQVPGTLTSFEDVATTGEQAVNCYRITAYEQAGYRTFSLSNESCVTLDPLLYTASAFTPNGDGFNDRFEIKGSYLQTYELRVYDRWGRILFEATSLSDAWDGRLRDGSPAPEGVYVFVVSAVGYQGQRVQRAGSVTLIR
ncbi:MAG: PKD domain-containing protein [Bacteroidia bacterium]|nr:PKD domain-containing protein [Bacteroidia bacterium]